MRHLSTFALLVLTSVAAPAQTLKNAPDPGLWETSWTTQINGQDLAALMRRAMAQAIQSMPASERAAAESMLQAQLQAFGGKHPECLTAAEAARATDAREVLADLQQEPRTCPA